MKKCFLSLLFLVFFLSLHAMEADLELEDHMSSKDNFFTFISKQKDLKITFIQSITYKFQDPQFQIRIQKSFTTKKKIPKDFSAQPIKKNDKKDTSMTFVTNVGTLNFENYKDKTDVTWNNIPLKMSGEPLKYVWLKNYHVPKTASASQN